MAANVHRAGFIMTLEPDDVEAEASAEEEGIQVEEKSGLAASFHFEPDEDFSKPWDFKAARSQIRSQKDSSFRTSVDAKIEKTLKRKREQDEDDEEEDNSEDNEEGEDSDSQSQGDENDSGSEEDENSKEEEEEEEEEDQEEESQEEESQEEEAPIDLNENTKEYTQFKKKPKKQTDSFFEVAPKIPHSLINSFESMNFSRPLMKAITELGWKNPTPIQRQVIPVALQGRDIAASAQTGSGKTGAFALPILERLLYRDTRTPTTRVLILLPTRELAAQCHSVITKLSAYCGGITVCLILGGLALQPQTVELLRFPDIIVATPGRLVDHLINTKAFGLDHLEILIMDEADRLLEMGFADEIKQIVQILPYNRHTMLFSATMTEKVDDLMKMTLNKPVRIAVDTLMETTKTLVQEFVKIPQSHEKDRPAVLLALCTRTFKSQTIVFFSQKDQVHKMKIIFGLAGLLAAELHGDLTQLQRLDALELFRDGKVHFLLCTDVASRGLDITGIKTVINYELPSTEAIYVHRVGRTARAGATGRSVSLISDSQGDRKLLKEIAKHTTKESVVKSRSIPADVISTFRLKLEEMKDDIEDVLQQEKEEKYLQLTERDANKAVNLIEHEEEIQARPKRVWYKTEAEKQETREKAKNGGEDDDDAEESKKGKEKKEKKEREIPLIKHTTKRQRVLREERERVLSPGAYKLAKKRTAKLDKLHVLERQRAGLPRNPPRPPKKKQKKETLPKSAVSPSSTGDRNKPKKPSGFKSKKRHKRR